MCTWNLRLRLEGSTERDWRMRGKCSAVMYMCLPRLGALCRRVNSEIKSHIINWDRFHSNSDSTFLHRSSEPRESNRRVTASQLCHTHRPRHLLAAVLRDDHSHRHDELSTVSILCCSSPFALSNLPIMRLTTLLATLVIPLLAVAQVRPCTRLNHIVEYLPLTSSSHLRRRAASLRRRSPNHRSRDPRLLHPREITAHLPLPR